MFITKLSFQFLLVLLAVSFSSVSAGCPCNNFTINYEELKNSSTPESVKITESLLPCLRCREKLGLHFYLCDVPKDILLAWPQIIEKYADDDRSIADLPEKTEDNCEEHVHFDIDRHTSGKSLVRAGMPLVIAGCGLSLFTPSVLQWGFSTEDLSGYYELGALVFLGRALVSLVYGIAGGLAVGGGTAMLIIGTKKQKEYQVYLNEIGRFRNDLRKIGVITIPF